MRYDWVLPSGISTCRSRRRETRTECPLDGAAVAHAHRAHDLASRLELDRLVTARKLAPGARIASTACGRRLALLGTELTEANPFRELCAVTRAGETDGNLAVVEG